MSNYYDGMNLKLLAAIPANARKVLEIGCANGKLGRRYKEQNANTYWVGIDISETAIQEAKHVLDETHLIDVDSTHLEALGHDYDVIVMGDLLEHLKSPERFLEKLYDCSSPDATLVCCLPNMTHISVVERLLCGDLSYDDMGLLDRTHLRFYSPASAFKNFLDCGWLPHMKDQYDAPGHHSPVLKYALEASQSLGVPKNTSLRHLNLYQMIITCRKWSMQILRQKGPMQPFSVIVPINRPWQFELNINRSPGLKEVNAQIIPVQNASSAAQAYEIGSRNAVNDWRVIVHQDVYFPTGSGLAIARHLGDLSQKNMTASPIGFAGLSGKGEDSITPAGMVVDRTHLFNHPSSSDGLSFDEFAVILHKDAAVKIDPRMGWHLWATDLCLQSRRHSGKAANRIIDVPLFHNSTNDYNLPAEFHQSAEVMLDKYPEFDLIETLCGRIQRVAVQKSIPVC